VKGDCFWMIGLGWDEFVFSIVFFVVVSLISFCWFRCLWSGLGIVYVEQVFCSLYYSFLSGWFLVLMAGLHGFKLWLLRSAGGCFWVGWVSFLLCSGALIHVDCFGY